jgi:hypothetical protein
VPDGAVAGGALPERGVPKVEWSASLGSFTVSWESRA